MGASSRRWGKVLALVAAAALGACAADSPDPTGTVGTWTLTAPLLEPRSGHSLTLLADGRVLVAGGTQSLTNDGSGPALSSAELYDPGDGRWTSTGSMQTPRALHAAVLLDSGRVLVAGGCNGWLGDRGWANCNQLASAELYDPATGEWSATGDMRSTRWGPAVLLPDGKVLVAGSETGASWAALVFGGEAELYDAATGRWVETGSMNAARAGPGMALLPSGQVLAVGGAASISGPTSMAELYDPGLGTWRITEQFGYPILDQTMTLLPTGEVLLACGREDYSFPSGKPVRPTAWLFNPATETWRPTGPMTYRQIYPVAVRLASGHVLLSGGNYFDFASGGAGFYPAPGGEVYDPWLDAWTPTPPMPHYISANSAAVLLPDGDVLQVGGNLPDGSGFEWEDLLSVSAAQRFHWDGPPAGPGMLAPDPG